MKNKHFQKIQNLFDKKIKSVLVPNNFFQNTRDLFDKKIKSLSVPNNFFQNTRDLFDKKIKSLSVSNNFFQNTQDLIEKSIKNNSQDVLLKQSPFWATSITWTLIGGTCFGVAWLSFAKTEEIVIAQGKLEPIRKVIDIQMPIEGITSKVLIKEGDKVKKGQTLIQLDTETSKSNLISLEKRLEINNLILEKFKILKDEGAVSEVQYLQQQLKLTQLQNEITASKVILKYQNITSPSDGIVFDLKPRAAGFVARTSEPVLKIVPIDNLKAKIEIDNRSIGFVNVNKKVDISIDSFPASDFGVIKGEITSIGSDALPPNPSLGLGYRFPADIQMHSQNLLLQDGSKLPLQPGMSLTANIKLRKVSYLKLLLNTFQDKADSLRAL